MPRTQRHPEAEARQKRAPISEPATATPTATPTATALHEVRRKTAVIPVRAELDEYGLTIVIDALRLASRVYRSLADAGFITPTEKRTLDAIAIPNVLAQKMEHARDDARHGIVRPPVGVQE
jgi:hypothetical protein